MIERRPFRARRPLGAPLALVAAASFGAGCTLLVDFVDQVEQAACEDGTCGPDAAFDGTLPDGRDDDRFTEPVGPDAHDGSVDVDAGPYAPCEGRSRGTYCATNGFSDWRGTRDDLAECDGEGGLTSVRTCAAGCTTMPPPFPDMCSPCPGEPNGAHCGHDLAAVPTISREFLIGCREGNVTTVYPCPNGCNITSSPRNQRTCYPPPR